MTMQISTLEGRLIAQRKLLARLVAALGDPGVDAFLADRESLSMLDEDPGAVPDDALAIEGAVADELHQIRELADRFRD